MADDKKNIPDAGKVDDPPKPGKVEPVKADPDYGRLFIYSTQKGGVLPIGQPSGWLFLFHNEGGF